MTKKTKKSGFSAPTIGKTLPKGTKIKKLPNGRIEIVESKKRGK